ncbi:unnamed protein product [Coffea canephora]|uniref:Nucleotide-diphospho-sugar transferase domain-containing protein n=1 Tax=Coffea canephora TaxID=49390 RepID=A0A068UW41_COFCA|nr:unnamed protein product [Coffea canephora]
MEIHFQLQKVMANLKVIFVLIYVIVLVGMFKYSSYFLSALYTSSSSSSSFVFSSTPGLNKALNSSHMTTENVMLATKPRLHNKLVKPVWEIPSTGSKMPPLKTFRLSKKLVQQRVKDNIVIVTYANYAFMDFVITWVKHLTDLGVENLLVGALDTKLLEALYWKGIPVFDMGSKMSIDDFGWGSENFHKMGREKAILIDTILAFGFELLMCDVDAIWLKNPLPYLARFPEADILTSTDQLVPTVVDDRLEIWKEVGADYNIGMFLWRPSSSSKKLAKEWKEMLEANETIWDQDGFNILVRQQLGPSVDGESGLVYAYDGNLKLGFLPASIFCSGHTYFIQAMYQQLRLEPYAVHTTFQFSGTEGKRHRLREATVFYDPPSYFDVPGGFLTFKLSIPKSLLLDGKHSIESHFALVNYQIKQIRTALAIALLLNRTLVMPPIWCRIDSGWLMNPQDWTGNVMRQPYVCPLDYVFEVNVMLMELQEDEYGQPIRIREHSFFENPLMPQKVKESRLVVSLCQEGSEDCQVSNATSQTGVLKVPKNSSEETYKTVFSSFKDVKVVQFSSMQDAFRGFTDKSMEENFRKRVTAYTSIWCCVNYTQVISYDIYWDEKPDWKPKPSRIPE